jgi:hypothetical protein
MLHSAELKFSSHYKFFFKKKLHAMQDSMESWLGAILHSADTKLHIAELNNQTLDKSQML